MSETIYILVVAFVGYVAYTVFTDKNGGTVTTHATAAEAGGADDVNQHEVSADAVEQEARSGLVGGELKNPLTGEVARIPNNYRFGKHWIKEALVAEGLLDRVYRNSELDSATNVKIQEAMASLKQLDKYKA